MRTDAFPTMLSLGLVCVSACAQPVRPGVPPADRGVAPARDEARAEVEAALARVVAADRTPVWGVVERVGPMTPAARAQLEDAGVALIAFAGRDAGEPATALHRWVVHRDAVGAAEPGFSVVAPEEKLAVALRVPANGAFAGNAREQVRLFVHAAPMGDTAAIAEAVRLMGGRVGRTEHLAPALVHAELPRGAAPLLARLAAVRYIEPAGRALTRNDSVRWAVQSMRPSSTPLYAMGVTGTGQIVGVIDDVVSYNHCVFMDPMKTPGVDHRKFAGFNYAPGTPSEHGTHVAGTIAGDRFRDDDTRGVAYGAMLAVGLLPAFNGETLLTKLERHAEQGARIHNNSWGVENGPLYDTYAEQIDRFTFYNDDHLVVVAVSNGTGLGSPETAKNALAVGATRDYPLLDAFCSGGAGPTPDGRRRPDVLAPGCGIASAVGVSCFTKPLSGTSMAAAATSGAAALLRQYLADGYLGANQPDESRSIEPTGALLRALLVAGSADTPAMPGVLHPREGFGRPVLERALPVPGGAAGLHVQQRRNNTSEALATGDVLRYRFSIDSAQPFTVVLAFSDAPAPIGAAYAPVNDLDLVVRSPSGAIYFANAFDADGDSLPNAAGPDTLNTIERVSLDLAEPGVWEVLIEASAVNVGSQGFGLAVVGAAEPRGATLADFDLDGDADPRDLELLSGWIKAGDLRADVNADGVADARDVLLFVADYRAWRR